MVSPDSDVPGNIIVEQATFSGGTMSTQLKARFVPDNGSSRELFDGFILDNCSLISNIVELNGGTNVSSTYDISLSGSTITVNNTNSAGGLSSTCTYSGIRN